MGTTLATAPVMVPMTFCLSASGDDMYPSQFNPGVVIETVVFIVVVTRPTGGGEFVGPGVGEIVGSGVGEDVGNEVGVGVGAGVGDGVGAGVGTGVGAGVCFGTGLGTGLGTGIGAGVGTGVGALVGDKVGTGVGALVGDKVGSGVVTSTATAVTSAGSTETVSKAGTLFVLASSCTASTKASLESVDAIELEVSCWMSSESEHAPSVQSVETAISSPTVNASSSNRRSRLEPTLLPQTDATVTVSAMGIIFVTALSTVPTKSFLSAFGNDKYAAQLNPDVLILAVTLVLVVAIPTGGEFVGLSLGIDDGVSDGCDEGLSDGTVEGLSLGIDDGLSDGSIEGLSEG